ncbi:hypothetical protein PSN45_002080 [Yamadazyma tenuis]|uniref:Endonuclease/exonuclease/phosphatase domain-containing protein n=1 Tax=Candida tenuis (strain ATCC 10573 / BCRC 21748 / CBS 615 / JCM 9827 / NBRC 10315 / NRRL Y-1498 / VKM Y-70) TaxID=590646 RepID=G3BCI7_CANTC|nr:uncharacterized protein CANTEDRAFT_136667 [Yamadazyma tenuis ATCC 10573]EGV60173.1 hypothetical protein CANTEDRAFT_136667 [Yamadazyma tenuis ATCC 10573]WEJ94589.1 hypothetical protein PSN45_002080 [Yamadazyma tenuis]
MGLGSIITKHIIPRAEKKFREHQNAPPSINIKNSQLPALQVQVFCHNVRQDAKDRMEGEEPWTIRREGVCANIYAASHKMPTIVGLQEVKHNQLHDILYGLGNDWKYFGVGRDDGKTKGEFAPILYRSSEWKLLNGATYWLSDDSSRPNIGWDAKCSRIVTLVTLQHSSGKIVNVFNTHYDHKGKQARINSSKLIMKLMHQVGDVSVLCGDLNSESHGEAYKTFTQGGLHESSCYCKSKRGYDHTDTGFKKGRKEKSIDFIWTTPDIDIESHEVLNHEYKGIRCSDHRPVTAVVQL